MCVGTWLEWIEILSVVANWAPPAAAERRHKGSNSDNAFSKSDATGGLLFILMGLRETTTFSCRGCITFPLTSAGSKLLNEAPLLRGLE